ncbi:MAG: HAD family hydrolase [Chloroflexota bacterium]|nr:HAD family hydrolase [Chloroflexota bacterium]
MSLDTSRIRALCFDVDGTLSDTDDQFVQKLAKMLHSFRFLFTSRDPRPFARRVVMATESPGNFIFGIPDRLGFDDEIAALGDTIYRWGLGKGEEPFMLIPGVKEMLLQLQPRYPMSVVSARGGRSTKWFLDQFELTPLFRSIATAQTCEYTKPYPAPIEWAAEQMDARPEECLMIGDTTVDILAAQAAGAQSVGVLCGFGEKDELHQAGADLILESTKYLLDVLQNA